MIDYARKQSPSEATIIRNCLRDNRPYPQAIQDAPSVKLEYVFFFNAYQDLSTCRYFEGAYIPWLAVREYGKANKLEYDDVELLSEVCVRIDDELMKQAKVKTKPTPEAPQPPPQTGKRKL